MMFLSDKEYPKAEDWMEECSFKFVDFSICVNDYCQSNAINIQEKDEEHSAGSGEIIEDHGSQDEVQKSSKIDQSNQAKRHIYVQKLVASMTNLLRWMDKEMTARLRSGAAVRKTSNLCSSATPLVQVETITTSKMRTETKVLATATCLRRVLMLTSALESRQ